MAFQTMEAFRKPRLQPEWLQFLRPLPKKEEGCSVSRPSRGLCSFESKKMRTGWILYYEYSPRSWQCLCPRQSYISQKTFVAGI